MTGNQQITRVRCAWAQSELNIPYHDEEWGVPGWSAADVLPYFLKAEDNERGASELHGAGGPLRVSDGRSRHQLMDAWIEAAVEAGVPRTADFNGTQQDGVGYYQLTQRGGMRCSAAVAYLHPALERPNLHLVTSAQTTRLLLEGSRVVGVEVDHHDQLEEFRASREVLLAAGAYGSPQILLLSGIGPATELALYGIQAVMPQFRERRRGHLITVSSMFSFVTATTSVSTCSAT